MAAAREASPGWRRGIGAPGGSGVCIGLEMNAADKARVGPAADGPAPAEEEEGDAGGKEPVADAVPGPSAAFRLLVTRREPAVKLQYAASGLEPLAWSEDHRVSVSTARSIAVLELICDVHNPGQDLVIHRTSVPAPLNSCLLKVSQRGPQPCPPPPAAAPSPGESRDPAPRSQHVGVKRPGLRWLAKRTQNLAAVVPSAPDHAPLPTHACNWEVPSEPGLRSPHLAGCWRRLLSVAVLSETPPPVDPAPDLPPPELLLSGADAPRPLAGFVPCDVPSFCSSFALEKKAWSFPLS